MIQKIVMMNFRGHNRTLEFGPGLNTLCGPNESGKSTVAQAISFLWLGTDSTGNKSPDHLITDGETEMLIGITTEHATVSRKKRRGQTSIIKVERHGYPAIQMNQSELAAVLKLSTDAFMSCWNAGYFMSLPQTQQLAVLGELAAVDRRALLQSMLPAHIQIPAKVKLVNPKIDADAIATERRQLQNVKSSDEGALRQLQAQLKELSGGGEVDIDSYTKGLNDLNAQLDAFDFYKKALSKYQQEKMRWGESINRKGGCEAGLMAIQLHKPEMFDVIKQTLEKNKRKSEDIRVSIKVLQDKAKPMPAEPKKPNTSFAAGSTCDKCGQVVGEAHQRLVMKHYEEDLLKYNKEAREVQTYNDRIKLGVEKGHAAMRDIDIESTQLSGQLDHMERSNRDSLKHKADLERELAEVSKLREPAAPEKPSGDEAAIRQSQLEFNTALNLARRQATQVDQLKAQENLLIEAVKVKDKQIMDYSALEYSLKNLPQMETVKILETLRVDGLSIALNEGNLSIMAGTIPYSSLSSGRKMKADLAFCGSLRRAAGSRAPSWVFCDNADLMDRWKDLLPPNVQVFAAKVDADLKELTVFT